MAPWRVLELITTSEKWLAERGIPDPRLDAEYLLAEVLHKDRVGLYVAFEQPLTEMELSDFRALLKRRGTREPLQHILGYTEFRGHRIATSKAALIPRPETELLVEKALELLRNLAQPRVIDIGTGTGCIAIALAKELTAIKILALDVSQVALDLARENVTSHQLADQITLRKFDILKTLPKIQERVDLVVSNPPYVSTGEKPALQKEVIDFEPPEALFDSHDGLEFYRRFAEILPRLLKSGGRFVFEFGGEPQEKSLLNVFMEAGFAKLEITRDYAGHPRLISGRYIS